MLPRLIVRRKLIEEEDTARYLTTQYVRLKPYIIMIEGENRTWPKTGIRETAQHLRISIS